MTKVNFTQIWLSMVLIQRISTVIIDHLPTFLVFTKVYTMLPLNFQQLTVLTQSFRRGETQFKVTLSRRYSFTHLVT